MPEKDKRVGEHIHGLLLNLRDIIPVALVFKTVVLPNPLTLRYVIYISSYFILCFSTLFYVQPMQLLTEAGNGSYLQDLMTLKVVKTVGRG